MNDIIMVTAFLHVVTVTAAKAPHVLTSVKTTCIPRYPVKENMNAYPYILRGFWKLGTNNVCAFCKVNNLLKVSILLKRFKSNVYIMKLPML